jgi:hypothetical protein
VKWMVQAGIGMIAPHCLHFPFLPANLSSSVNDFPHSGQENVMLIGDSSLANVEPR